VTDQLTAPGDAIPRRDPSALTLADCWRAFIRQRTPPLIAAAVLAAVVLRVALGVYGWRDLVVIAFVIAGTPVAEWLIHVYLLHAKPLRIGERRYDLLAAREHRAHHQAPAALDGVLIPRYAVLIFIPLLAVTVWLVSFPVHLVLGGDRLAGAATGLLVSYLVLAGYEWCHFLIHTPYRPRGRYYRSLWRGHRLHHYKNEHYWFGVTSTVGDRLLRTAPEQSEVEKSRTARTLGVDVRSRRSRARPRGALLRTVLAGVGRAFDTPETGCGQPPSRHLGLREVDVRHTYRGQRPSRIRERGERDVDHTDRASQRSARGLRDPASKAAFRRSYRLFG
jgi:sterol desaturase/sphingolipid hydroxylase (fatty acid hydroxylase superfamily)